MIKNYIKDANFEDTGFSYTLSLISGKYKMVILYCLMEFEPVRFNELKRYLKNISDKTLSANLKELESDRLVIRKEYPQIPPKVEYRLSERGKSLMVVLDQLCVWGEENKENIENKGQAGPAGEMHGTVELMTDRLTLRRYRPEDADLLFQELGTDPMMFQYSGWNPYATQEMAQDTVKEFIDSYDDVHFYGWAIDSDGALVGTIGAYDYKADSIEVGFSIVRECWGLGYATEALKSVLSYLTENEGIPCVTAWCAAKNAGSGRVLEKAGMQLVGSEKDGLVVGNKKYDKLFYEYKKTI